jgi:hypothetical protein
LQIADSNSINAVNISSAQEWSIYTRAELRILCEQNRVAPLSATELNQWQNLTNPGIEVSLDLVQLG